MADRDPTLVKYEKRFYIVGFGLFAAFFVQSMIIGGDAINGRIEDGVYYVSSHGRDTIVSETTYFFSRALGTVAIISFLLMFIYTILRNLIYGRPR